MARLQISGAAALFHASNSKRVLLLDGVKSIFVEGLRRNSRLIPGLLREMVRQVVISERAAVTSEDFIASNVELIIAQPLFPLCLRQGRRIRIQQSSYSENAERRPLVPWSCRRKPLGAPTYVCVSLLPGGADCVWIFATMNLPDKLPS